MSSHACSRCAEGIVKPEETKLRLCGFCVGELTRSAVGQLAGYQGPGDQAKLKRAEAIEGLRQLGYTDKQVLRARARAFEGHLVDEISEELRGEGVRVRMVVV